MTKELLLDAVSVLSEKAEIRETYAEHLCDLFEHIDGTKIGEAYCRAAENGDIAAMIRLLAAYYRQKPSAAVDWLTAQGPYDVTAADRAVRGEMREVNIDWTFEGGEVDFLFDPTAIKGPRNHEWL